MIEPKCHHGNPEISCEICNDEFNDMLISEGERAREATAALPGVWRPNKQSEVAQEFWWSPQLGRCLGYLGPGGTHASDGTWLVPVDEEAKLYSQLHRMNNPDMYPSFASSAQFVGASSVLKGKSPDMDKVLEELTDLTFTIGD